MLPLIKVFVYIEDIDQVLIEDHRSASVSLVKFRYADAMMVFESRASKVIYMNFRSSSRSHPRFLASRHIFPSADQIVTQPFLFLLAIPIVPSNSGFQRYFHPDKLSILSHIY